jgi:hypothetical protein
MLARSKELYSLAVEIYVMLTATNKRLLFPPSTTRVEVRAFGIHVVRVTLEHQPIITHLSYIITGLQILELICHNTFSQTLL